MQKALLITRKLAVRPEKIVDSVSLDHEGRGRRRIVLTGDKGTQFLLDLEKSTVLNDGDAVKLEDGSLVLIKAAPQTLIEVKSENPLRLLKTAWHIGNRHTPCEITADALYIEEDHVLAEMIRGLGCSMQTVSRPFQPERGAYDDHGHAHGHSHGHGHGHSHAHDHRDHDHHDHDHHGHDHHDDKGCGCGHHHAHSHDHSHD